VGRPVERAEKGARGDGGVGGAQRAAADAVDDQRADAVLVAIAFGDDEAAQARRQCIHFEMRGRAFHLVEQAEHMGDREAAEPIRDRPAIAPRVDERREQAVERAVLAEEQDLVLPAKVVIEIAGGEVGGDRDLAHARGGEPVGAKGARRGAHDLEPAVIGAA
jgi:hypothetical protein